MTGNHDDEQDRPGHFGRRCNRRSRFCDQHAVDEPVLAKWHQPQHGEKCEGDPTQHRTETHDTVAVGVSSLHDNPSEQADHPNDDEPGSDGVGGVHWQQKAGHQREQSETDEVPSESAYGVAGFDLPRAKAETSGQQHHSSRHPDSNDLVSWIVIDHEQAKVR